MVHFSFADAYVFGSREGKKLAWHPDFSGMVKDEDKYMGKEGGGGGGGGVRLRGWDLSLICILLPAVKH